MDAQKTLRRQISCAGIGLHSGHKVTLTLKPALADTGIVFRRTDLGVEIPATVAQVSAFHYATVLGRNGATVETVEHLLAALVSVGIDNVVVELDRNEVPIMDGSAAPFLYLVQEAGIKRLSVPRRYMKILRPVQLAQGDKRIAIYPSDHFKVSYTISFDHPLLRHQSRTERITEQSFAESIAPARTFGFLKEVETLRQNGLALGGSLENAIVIGDAGVLNAVRGRVRSPQDPGRGWRPVAGRPPDRRPRRRASRRPRPPHGACRAAPGRARRLGARRSAGSHDDASELGSRGGPRTLTSSHLLKPSRPRSARPFFFP
jgi:UDP-3-O-[3-hydroxymyristoyl] N-acetylglucosamine deacetylase